MNGGIIPSLLLAATIGLLLSFAPRRLALIAIACMALAAGLFALPMLPTSLTTAVFVVVWLTIMVAAGLTFGPPSLAQHLAIPLAIVAGAGVGALAAVLDRRSDLLLAVPAGLLFVPGAWLVARGRAIGVKIVASWMLAIALLSMFVSLTPTPGYQPDHME